MGDNYYITIIIVIYDNCRLFFDYGVAVRIP